MSLKSSKNYRWHPKEQSFSTSSSQHFINRVVEGQVAGPGSALVTGELQTVFQPADHIEGGSSTGSKQKQKGWGYQVYWAYVSWVFKSNSEIKFMAGYAMLDTGCSRMVAGMRWYLKRRKVLRERWGLSTIEFFDTESYRFGPGPVAESLCAALIPSCVVGCNAVLRISIVPGEIPLLMSHGAMEELDLVYHPETRLVHSGHSGEVQKAERFHESHPMLDICGFSPDGFTGEFDLAESLEEVRLAVPTANPNSTRTHTHTNVPEDSVHIDMPVGQMLSEMSTIVVKIFFIELLLWQ